MTACGFCYSVDSVVAREQEVVIIKDELVVPLASKTKEEAVDYMVKETKLSKKEQTQTLPPAENNEVPVFNEEVKIPDLDDALASSTAPVVFTYPVTNYTLGRSYSDTKLVYNETLKEYTTHLGIDFIVPDGSSVVASYGGTVESISYDSLTGTTIVLDHGDGLKTSYMSLSSDVAVKEGQAVKTGEVIGKASSSATGEQSLGAHLHFEAMQDGEYINPLTYLGEK